MNPATKPQLHYEIHGDSGPFLLLVHGMLSSRAQWIPNLDNFKEFCRPVVVELFGHGRSPSPTESHYYRPEGYLEQFEAIREQLGAERWLICGQSLGASLTLRYAFDFPHRIIAQVATNSRSAFSDEDWRQPMKEQAEGLSSQGHSYIERHPLNPTRSKRMTDQVKAQFEQDTKLVSALGLSNTGLHTVCNAPVRGRLAANKIPCLLVNGEWERKFQPHRDYASQYMTNLQVKNLPGGHAINLDASDAFNQAVREFFDSQLGRQPDSKTI